VKWEVDVDGDGMDYESRFKCILLYFNSGFCFMYITHIHALVNTNNISNTRNRVSIDAGLKSVEADRVLYFNSRRDK
jgi:hypothetical protein